jgi:hypothetical protein
MNVNLINKLALSLNSKQLAYNRINFQKVDEILPIQNQLQIPKIPEHAQSDIDTDEYNFVPTTGKDSFLHCILKALYTQYDTLSWVNKTKLVTILRDSLLYKLNIIRGINDIIVNLDESLIKQGIKSTELVSLEAKCYISAFFNINIIIIDQRQFDLIISDKIYCPYKTTIILYESDDGTYYILHDIANDKNIYCLSNSDLLKSLHPKFPANNKYYIESSTENIVDIDPIKSAESADFKKLMKFSLVELQNLAEKENISITKISKLTGKAIKLKKEELAQELVKSLT